MFKMRPRTCRLWFLTTTCVVMCGHFTGVNGLETLNEFYQQARSANQAYSSHARVNVVNDFYLLIIMIYNNRVDPCGVRHIDRLSVIHRLMADHPSHYVEFQFLHRYTLAVAKICNLNVYSNLAEIQSKLVAHPELDILKDNHSGTIVTQLATVLGSEVASQLPQEALEEPKNEDIFIILGTMRRSKLNITLPMGELEKVERKITVCNQYAPYYENAIMSIARLADLGYAWKQENLFSNVEQKKKGSAKLTIISPDDRNLLKKWLNIATQCEFVLRSNIDYSTQSSSIAELRLLEPLNYHIMHNYSNMVSFDRNTDSMKQLEEVLKKIDYKSMVQDTYEQAQAPFKEMAMKKELERKNRPIWSKMGEEISRVIVKKNGKDRWFVTPVVATACALYIIGAGFGNFAITLGGAPIVKLIDMIPSRRIYNNLDKNNNNI